MIRQLGLEGHDSELFSFLDAELVEQLKSHPSAGSALWTFGRADELGALNSLCSWNCYDNLFPVTTAMVFTKPPDLHREPNSRFHTWRGYTTDDPLICVEAIAIVRYLMSQGVTAALDGNHWLREPIDWQCDRLKFIRDDWTKWRISYPTERAWQQTWTVFKANIFRWCMLALDSIPVGLTEEVAA